MKITHKNIRKQSEEFNRLKNYKEKLAYFDKIFGVLPVTFPSFHPKLRILFEHTEIEILSRIYESERTGKNPLLKEFVFENEKYLFDVIPETPQRQIFNDFVLNKIIETDHSISVYVEYIKSNINSQSGVEDYLSESFNLINLIRNRKGSNTERSYRNQFMNVFLEGYQDSQNGFIKKFPSKKKFVELYLYAQGILFNKYIEQINNLKLSKEKSSVNLISNKTTEPDNVHSKLVFLDKLGILDLLKYRYSYMERKDLCHHLAETVGKITGDPVHKIITELNRLQLFFTFGLFSIDNIVFDSQLAVCIYDYFI